MKFICRLPFAEDYILAIHENIGKNRVEFSSFTGNKKLELKNNSLTYLKEENLENLFLNEVNLPEIDATENFPTHESYIEEVKKAIEIIRENNLPKLVISRPIKKHKNFSQ